MSWTNRVIWQEGMFLRAQHFQQQDRWLEMLVRTRAAWLRPYPWGLVEMAIDRGRHLIFDDLLQGHVHLSQLTFPLIFVLTVLGSLACATLSYYFVERPILRMKHRVPRVAAARREAVA